MQRTIKLTIAYHGRCFHGWQRQPGLRTVQGHVEEVAQRVLGEPLSVQGASRTDAGVHAQGQVAHFHTRSPIPVHNLRRAITHRLDDDVSLVHAETVTPEFHASRGALSKLYRYRIYQHERRPVESLLNGLAWHVWTPIDFDALYEAAAALCGTHDFAGFASAGSPRENTIRTVRHVHARRRFNLLLIDVCGDGFLYNQVRNMVGTLVEIGRGRWPVDRIDEILAARDRRLAGPTAPAHGLCLQWVRYPAQRPMEG